MNKSIKETFIENMIMNQHGEKIKQVQELMIKGVNEAKKSIEKSIIWEVSHGKNTNVIEYYGEQLDEVDNLLKYIRFNLLDIDLDVVRSKIFQYDIMNLKEYDELVDTLKQELKCESCVHTYKIEDKGRLVNDTQFAKIHENETILNSEETEEILNNISKSEKVMDNIIQELGEKTKDSGEEIGKALSDVVNIFINDTDLNHPHKDVAEWARKLSEALKKNKGGW